MQLNKVQIEEIRKVNSIEELESKIKEKNIALSKETISSLYNTYCVNNLELSDNELDNVTGGCGEKIYDRKSSSCAEFFRVIAGINCDADRYETLSGNHATCGGCDYGQSYSQTQIICTKGITKQGD